MDVVLIMIFCGFNRWIQVIDFLDILLLLLDKWLDMLILNWISCMLSPAQQLVYSV